MVKKIIKRKKDTLSKEEKAIMDKAKKEIANIIKRKKNLVGKNIMLGWIHLEVQSYIRKGKNEFSKRRF